MCVCIPPFPGSWTKHMPGKVVYDDYDDDNYNYVYFYYLQILKCRVRERQIRFTWKSIILCWLNTKIHIYTEKNFEFIFPFSIYPMKHKYTHTHELNRWNTWPAVFIRCDMYVFIQWRARFILLFDKKFKKKTGTWKKNIYA